MENIGIYEWTVVLLGMGTVFVALIGLWWILEGFSVAAGSLAKKKAAAAAAAEQSETTPERSSVPGTGGVSPEVVAAITAALAAATGRRASEIRITHVAPSSSGSAGLNTPVWGYANRLAAGRR